jgi:hypothetical protein
MFQNIYIYTYNNILMYTISYFYVIILICILSTKEEHTSLLSFLRVYILLFQPLY